MKVAISYSGVPSFIEDKSERKAGPYNNEQLGRLWLDWVSELGGVEHHELVLLIPDSFEVPGSAKAWKKVIRLNERHQVSGWPQGPNKVFQQILWWIHLNKLTEPVFWMEPDAIPLKPYWIDAWVEEYQAAKKPFMGAYQPEIPNYTTAHMTGIAIYPPNAMELAPRLFSAQNTAWDVWAASEVLPKMHATKLLQHAWQHLPITTMAEYQKEISPLANIFHTDKYGALIGLFRSQRDGSVAEPDPGQIIRKAFGGSPEQEEPAAPAPLLPLPAVATIDHVMDLMRTVVITEELREELLGRMRDDKFFFRNFGKPIEKGLEPYQLARSHGRA